MHTSTVRLAGLFLAAALLAACPNPADKSPKADVTDAGGGSAGGDKKMREGAIPLTSQNTEISWVGSKVTRSHDGGFKTLQGYATLADGNLDSVYVVIEMATVFADAGRLTGHLKTDDFFDVRNHPTAVFKSTQIEASDAEGGSHTVTGDMTIRGVTKQISFPAKVMIEGKRIQMQSEFSLARKQFGVKWEGSADDLVRDDVLVRIRVDAAA